MIKKYLDSDSLVFESYDAASKVQEILIKEGYCVMLSKEEEFWVLNWVWTERPADRNCVIFINRGDYESDWWNFVDNHPEIKWSDEDEDGAGAL